MEHLDASTAAGVALAAVIAITTSSVLYYYSKKPDATTPLATHDIVDLRIYPIKSCRGIQVQSAVLLKTGLDLDRNWMFVSAAKPDWLETNTTLRSGIIWGQETDGWEYPATMTRAISDFIGVEARLLYKGPTPRVLRGCGAPDRLGRAEATNFADMMPVLVASLASLAELNGQLRDGGDPAIDIERFPPNIIIRGHDAWAEYLLVS
ncbi:uncharacterized protein B0I36DRAFT_357193 [Microdochium trichocladiopsis]|uniref:MOSC domain-containing protein n=1 Tax=Microdochium trichocladiopsis TaxID=1682393 RepID=A0A9P9BVJ6_9PEZI|nr:uncharacterized protein B0I36DRAFT_357193 [Microdochium trichocladiopsis]KAH7039807.1 hypothetical protein B0I36DRAFT_357193 [Microdochium trichocladiopsis]